MTCRHTVSVLLPVHNGGNYVSAAIASVLQQTHEDLELIVVDDGSTDDTPRVLRHWAGLDSRMTVLTQKNAGVTQALNAALSNSRGDFVARLDADDVAAPNRLKRQVEYCCDRPEVGVVSSWAEMVTADGASITVLCYPDSDDWIRQRLSEGTNPLVHSAVMFRRAALAVSPPVYRFRHSQDFDLWLRLLPLTRFGIVQQALVRSRHHGARMSAPSSRRRALHELIHAQYLGRRDGIGETDWECEQAAILAAPDRRPSPEALQAYIQGLQRWQRGDRIAAARKFVDSAADRELRLKSLFRLAACAIPQIARLPFAASRDAAISTYHRSAADAIGRPEIDEWAMCWAAVHSAAHTSRI